MAIADFNSKNSLKAKSGFDPYLEVSLPINMDVSAETRASGILTGNKFGGTFAVLYNTSGLPTFHVTGDFEVMLA